MRSRARYAFVKNMSVNGGQLPTTSENSPDLVRKENFCTFADVEKCPERTRPRELINTPTAEGRGLNVQYILYF